jgi:hypothetical protein
MARALVGEFELMRLGARDHQDEGMQNVLNHWGSPDAQWNGLRCLALVLLLGLVTATEASAGATERLGI